MTAKKDSPDLSEFVALSGRGRRPCKVQVMIDQLDEANKEKVIAALESDENFISTESIVKWFKLRDKFVTSDPLRKHRRKLCCCVDRS